MSRYIGLDFETYSGTDLTVHGLHRYVEDPTFQPLIASTVKGSEGPIRYNFVTNPDDVNALEEQIDDLQIVAHNALFEQAVLRKMGLNYPSTRFVDSAVVARAAGGGSRLEAAAPQLLGIDKMAEGRDLIKLFCVPGPYQEMHNTRRFVPEIFTDHPAELALFEAYCDRDAELGLDLVLKFRHTQPRFELSKFAPITLDMNNTGWTVDTPLVEEMQRRYQENMEQALWFFRSSYPDAADLNLNSLKQMKEWCAKRGIRASSFAEKPLERMRKRLEDKLDTMQPDDPKYWDYSAVLNLCKTKQILGGSSLKKLQVILDTAVPDPDRPGQYLLKDQYVHCGAGQTLRTTGRSAQLQNLKRLDEHPADMSELDDITMLWDNDLLAENLRQVFTASHPQGRLIVGDFKSVESRGLAWYADEQWKLAAYFNGIGIYESLAAKIFSVPIPSVTKPQRTAGKVGELSCGYQAGAGAVQSFAAGMNIELTEAEAAKIVYDWRDACPKTVDFWERLDRALHNVVEHKGLQTIALLDSFSLDIGTFDTPGSLKAIHPTAQSVVISVWDSNGQLYLRRYFHGCYVRGRNICYYKPSSRKTGALWSKDFIDPKTKQRRYYEIYGGKLAGILTQSLCREIFFRTLVNVKQWVDANPQLRLVGQFHDEIVVDWSPGPLSLQDAKLALHRLMSTIQGMPSFPLDADIKDDYRYIK